MRYSKRTINCALLGAILATALTYSAGAQAAKLYKWVDKNGNISYQDQPPPESATILQEDTIKTTATSGDASRGNRNPLIVYTTAGCPVCDRLITSLGEMGVPVDNRVLDDNRDMQRRLLEATQTVTVPTVEMDGRFITDINLPNLRTQLSGAGYVLKDQDTAADIDAEQ